jgi:hypothetical protein
MCVCECVFSMCVYASMRDHEVRGITGIKTHDGCSAIKIISICIIIINIDACILHLAPSQWFCISKHRVHYFRERFTVKF